MIPPPPHKRKFVPTILCHADSRPFGKLIDSYCSKDLKNKELWYREFLKGLEDGYSFENVRQVHVYKVTNQMFRKQIETFFRVKLVNGNKLDQKEITELTAKLLVKFGWELTQKELKTLSEDKNDPLTQLAKKCLNTLWGKFGQKECSCCEYVNSNVFWEPMQMHAHKEVEIESHKITRPGEARVRWKNLELPNAEMSPLAKKACKLQRQRHERLNVAVASAVTANARLRLLKAIDAVGDRFIYCDTDSVSYVRDLKTPGPFSGEGTLVEGCLLGEWEQKKLCDEMVIDAKKSYACIMAGECVKIRAKGITLTYHNSKRVSHSVMRDQLEGFVAECPPPPIKTRKLLFE